VIDLGNNYAVRQFVDWFFETQNTKTFNWFSILISRRENKKIRIWNFLLWDNLYHENAPAFS